MATRNKRKLAALNKENCEEHPRSNLAQNSTAPRSQEDYITQVSEEIEGRVTKKLSQEFSRTENRILGALARLDDFLMNPLLQGHSGITPETSRNVLSINQGTNEDDSQSDPHPEAGPLTSGREERRDSLLFCAIFLRIWKQNLPLNWAISYVFLPDVCQLRSRHNNFVHASESKKYFSTKLLQKCCRMPLK